MSGQPQRARVRVRRNPHMAGCPEGVQCGDVLYLAPELFDPIMALPPADRGAAIDALTVLFLPALGEAGQRSPVIRGRV